MKTTTLILIVFCCISLPSKAQQDDNPDAITGKWLMIEKGFTDTIEIFKQSGKYYGKLIGLGEPFDKDVKPKRDEKNRDKNLRKRLLKGIIALTDLVYDEDNVWDDGEMYYPKDGKTYSCKITLKNNDTIEARYYWGFSLLGYSEEWKRLK